MADKTLDVLPEVDEKTRAFMGAFSNSDSGLCESTGGFTTPRP